MATTQIRRWDIFALIRFRPEEAVPLLDEYQKAIEALHVAAAKICAKAGVPYRAPRGFETPQAGGGGTEAGETAESAPGGREERKRKAG